MSDETPEVRRAKRKPIIPSHRVENAIERTRVFLDQNQHVFQHLKSLKDEQISAANELKYVLKKLRILVHEMKQVL